MAFWRTTAETSATLATEEHSLAQISDGILAGVIAWTPATAIFFFSTIFIVRRYNPDFIFYGGLVVLFYMCVIGTGMAMLAGYLVFLPVIVWSCRRGISPLLVNVALALLLVWFVPTVVLSIMSGSLQMSHGFSAWFVAPAITCCFVFHFHQRWARRADRRVMKE